MGLNTGTIIHKRYRIVKLLGQGGFGAVYRGWDISLNRPCAIKENLDTSPEAQRQFLREATTLANLSHPTLPRVTDHFILQGQGQYLVMDFVEGENLESLIARQGAVAPQQALAWIVQVADALDYLHGQTQPIIHRDIKPANIILIPNGRVMLVDFGLVKVYDPQLRTTSGARAVTPGYSPPEQYGHGNTDARTDIYALAATLYTLLTGQEPQESVQRIVQDTLAPAAPLHPQIPPEIGQVIRQAMSLSPSQRYQSAEAFKQGLLQEKTTILPPPGRAPAPPKPVPPTTAPGTTRPLVWGSLFGGALVLILLTAALFQFALWPTMRGREAAATATVEAAEIAALDALRTVTRVAAGTATSEAEKLVADSTATAVRAATNVAQEALRAEARATGSVRAGITATAKANATAVVSATRTALEAAVASSTLIFGPQGGSLEHEEDGLVEVYYADVSVRIL